MKKSNLTKKNSKKISLKKNVARKTIPFRFTQKNILEKKIS